MLTLKIFYLLNAYPQKYFQNNKKTLNFVTQKILRIIRENNDYYKSIRDIINYMRYLFELTLITLIAIFFFILGILVKTKIDINSQENAAFTLPVIEYPSKMSLRRFSGGLKYKTISTSIYEQADFTQFKGFIKYIQTQYHPVFSKCEVEFVNKYGIVLKLSGKDSEKLPNLLTAHYDTAGIEDETKWKYAPFSGYFDEEYIYSRGTIDAKGSVFAILESLNELIKQNFQPEADLYIAFSHTAENGSNQGSQKIMQYFQSKNIHFNTVLNEGGRIINKHGKYYAFIGTEEKGRLLSKITVKSKGGYAGLPENNSAVEKLAKLINAFSKNKSKAVLTKELKEYYYKTYSSYRYRTKILISNINLLRPLFYWHMSKYTGDNARLRSTYAVTVIEASNIQNAVSSEASMIIDARIIPSQTVDETKKYLERIIKKTLRDKNTKIEYLTAIEPCSSSSTESDEYKKLVDNIQKLYPGLIVTPYLTLVSTEARDYSLIADNTYRFLPAVLTDEEAALMHADNEKISIENWARMIAFYKEFIQTR